MSVQFGKCNFDGRPVDPQDLDEVRPVLAPYGPDGEGYICKDNVGILCRCLHTTRESRREIQPYASASGVVVTWDGCLDNREELIGEMSNDVSSASTDLEIVVAAYQRLETNAFAKLIGDWAVSVWDPQSQSLVLAKDFIGCRHLYYSIDIDQVTWCTILDPLVLFARRPVRLQEEFIAGWLSGFAATHLTPYVDIHAVPPSCFIRIERGAQRVSKYWDFDPAKNIRYGTDREYEEHFRLAFSESVRRRLRSDSPVLAELSGGVDSSSIVCMADEIARRGPFDFRTVETISYYDDSEPNWDERSYFTAVEARRGKTGSHIDVGRQRFVPGEIQDSKFAPVPRPIYRSPQASEQFTTSLKTTGSRILLCGIGGDEVTGGVPTPIPEIRDLLVTAQLARMAHQLKVWALQKRKPWFHLFFETVGGFLPLWLSPIPDIARPVPWLNSSFSHRNRLALMGYPRRVKWCGPQPSFQENLTTIEALRRQLGCEVLSSEPAYEIRYPYLDRGLLEFLFAIPREQLLRPGQRRSLMRRALSGIVPAEILNRKRKAYVSRTPIAAVSTQYPILIQIAQRMAATDAGIVDPDAFREALRRVRDGSEARIVQLIRILEVEHWLAEMITRKVETPPAAFHESKGSAGSTHQRAQRFDPAGSNVRQIENEWRTKPWCIANPKSQ